MTRRARDEAAPRALDLLEDAVLLLRGASPVTWAVYAAGTVPFLASALVLGFDLARDGGAAASLPIASLGLALLFVAMKAAQAVFCERLRSEGLGGAGPEEPASLLVTASRQAAIQPWGLVLVPLAFLATVPFGWTYAFFQSSLAEGRRERSLSALVSRSSRQAGLWPGQNHQLLLVLLAVRLFVFLDVLVLLVVLPALLRTFTGFETELARSGASLLSVPLLLVGLGVTHVLVDPLVKAVYVLRCFHGESQRTGEDLLVALARRTASAAGLVLLCFLSGSGLAAPPSAASPRAVDASRLDRALTTVLAERRFAWHLPKERRPGATSAFEDFLRGLGDVVTGAARAAGRLIEGVARFLAERLRWGPGPSPDGETGTGLLDARLLLFAALALVAVVAGLFLLRLVRRRAPAAVVAAAPAEIDLLEPSVAADAREPDEWLALGQEWLAKGDPRRALRALYLAGLGALSKAGLVRLAPHKSNGDYVRELARRATGGSPLPPRFAEVVKEFDRVWYGEHPVSAESLARFRDDVLEVRSLAST